MELRNNDFVFFDPVSHTYITNDGELLIGVTGLMKKHGLGADYSGIPEKVLNKAAEEGTAIHKEIEDYDNGLSVLKTPLIEEYIAICKEYGLNFVSSEYLVSDDEMVASSIDSVYEAKQGAILVDFKSTSKLHKRALEWQLGIYKVFFERQNPEIPVAACYCLQIDKKTRKIKGMFLIEPVSEAEVNDLLDAERNGRIYIDQHEEPSAGLVLTDEELAAYVNHQHEIADLKAKVKAIEETLKDLDKRVMDYMVEHNLEKLEGEGGVFTIKKAYTRTTIDTERFKRLQPGLFNQYSKTATVAASLTFKPSK